MNKLFNVLMIGVLAAGGSLFAVDPVMNNSSVDVRTDGSKMIKDADGTVIEVKSDGSKIIKKADGTEVMIRADGTKTINTSNGKTMDVRVQDREMD